MKPYLNDTNGSSKSLSLKQPGRKMKIFYLLMAVVAMHVVTVSSGYASTLVIGNPPDAGNCFPLGCQIWAPQYQQVYASSDFSSPIMISGLTFYNTLGQANNGFDTGTYSFSLSSTSKAVDGLDLSNLNNNIGANNTLVFSGTLPQGPIPVGGSATVTFSTPFTYDPGSGLNLLLYIQSPNPGLSLSFFDADNGNAGGLFSRAMTPGCCFGTSDWGLVTGFVTSAPEPATLFLVGVGIGFVGVTRNYRRNR